MSNVIDFPQVDLKDSSYMDVDGEIGACMRDKSLEIFRIPNEDKWQIQASNGKVCMAFDREELAEFLHVAIALIDDCGIYKPPFELIGKDY